MYELNTQYNYRKELIFGVLVAIGYKDKKSIPDINAYGIPKEIKTGQTIGTGRKYVKSFIDKVWWYGTRISAIFTYIMYV